MNSSQDRTKFLEQIRKITQEYRQHPAFVQVSMTDTSALNIHEYYNLREGSFQCNQDPSINSNSVDFECKIIFKGHKRSFSSNDLMKIQREIPVIINQLENLEPKEKDQEYAPETPSIQHQDQSNLCENQNLQDAKRKILDFVKQKLSHVNITNLSMEISLDEETSVLNLINNQGFDYENSITSRGASVEMTTDFGDQKYTEYISATLSKFTNLEQKLDEILEKLNHWHHKTSLKTNKYPCFLSHELSAYFIEKILSLTSGKSIYHKESYFVDKKNTLVLSPDISIRNLKSPYVKNTYDLEGQPTKDQDLIIDGILKTYICNKKYSELLKEPQTANSLSTGAFGHLDISSSNPMKSKPQNYVEIDGIISSNFNSNLGELKATCLGFIMENGQRKNFNNVVISIPAKSFKTMMLTRERKLMVDSHDSINIGQIFFSDLNISGE